MALYDFNNLNGNIVATVIADNTELQNWQKGVHYAREFGAGASTKLAIYGNQMPFNTSGQQLPQPLMSPIMDYTDITIGGNAPSSATDAVKQLNTFFFDISGSSSDPIQITYSALSTLITAQTAVEGYYLLTDRADAGILVYVGKDTNGVLSVSPNALGYFYNADYQNVSGNVVGIWAAASEGGYVNGNIVIFKTTQFTVIDVAACNGTDPTVNTTAYGAALAKTAANSYQEEARKIVYNFATNTILLQYDQYGNVVNNNVSLFPYGNNNVLNNDLSTANTSDCGNFGGTLKFCSVISGGVITLGSSNASIIGNTIVGAARTSSTSSTGDYSLLVANETIYNCYITQLTVQFPATKSFSNLTINQTSSFQVYNSIISQTGTSAPSKGVEKTNISGTFTWARTSAGLYTLTNIGAPFTAGKTIVKLSPPPNSTYKYIAVVTSTSVITITTLVESVVGGVLTETATDGLLTNANLEIDIFL